MLQVEYWHGANACNCCRQIRRGGEWGGGSLGEDGGAVNDSNGTGINRTPVTPVIGAIYIYIYIYIMVQDLYRRILGLGLIIKTSQWCSKKIEGPLPWPPLSRANATSSS